MKVRYPPVGTAHIAPTPVGLLQNRASSARHVRFACVTQPKTSPHLGTALVVDLCFALAREFRERLGIPTSVLVDLLDNSPAEEWLHEGIRFSRPLSHALEEGRTRAELFTEPLRRIADFASAQLEVPYSTRTYSAIQSTPSYRRALNGLLRDQTACDLLAPMQGKLRVRPLCPVCGVIDKDAFTVELRGESLFSSCPDHGRFEVALWDDAAVIDANTPVRTICRSFDFACQEQHESVLTVLVNGADWGREWMQLVFLPGLELLEIPVRSSPPTVFSPLVLDESAAKLSKTIYLDANSYDERLLTWVSYPRVLERYGEAGQIALLGETRRWAKESRRLMRDYSVEYFAELLGNLASTSQ